MSTASETVRDVKPPLVVIRILNPIMRTVLRTPLGRVIKPFALLEFAGRRTGRRFRVPVGWHVVDGAPVVFTPAPWRANFADTMPVTVRHRGRAEYMTGSLVKNPSEVAAALDSLFASGAAPRTVGLDLDAGHQITPADVLAVDRAMIRFEVVDALPSTA